MAYSRNDRYIAPISWFVGFYDLNPSRQNKCIYFVQAERRDRRCNWYCGEHDNDREWKNRAVQLRENIIATASVYVSIDLLREYILHQCCQRAQHQSSIEDNRLLIPLAERWKGEIEREEKRKAEVRREETRKEQIRQQAIRQEEIRKEQARKEEIRKEEIRKEQIRREEIRNEEIRRGDILKEIETLKEAIRRQQVREEEISKELIRQEDMEQELVTGLEGVGLEEARQLQDFPEARRLYDEDSEGSHDGELEEYHSDVLHSGDEESESECLRDQEIRVAEHVSAATNLSNSFTPVATSSTAASPSRMTAPSAPKSPSQTQLNGSTTAYVDVTLHRPVATTQSFQFGAAGASSTTTFDFNAPQLPQGHNTRSSGAGHPISVQHTSICQAPLESKFRIHIPKPLPADCVSSKIQDRLDPIKRDFECGSLYIFERESSPGHVKIGWTAARVQDRLDSWSECGYDPELLFQVDGVPYAHRVETLTHYELIKEWRRERVCDGCGASHREWFEVRKERAAQVLLDWANFFKKFQPYDSNGILKSQWSRVVNAMDEKKLEITAKSLVKHYETRLREAIEEIQVAMASLLVDLPTLSDEAPLLIGKALPRLILPPQIPTSSKTTKPESDLPILPLSKPQPRFETETHVKAEPSFNPKPLLAEPESDPDVTLVALDSEAISSDSIVEHGHVTKTESVTSTGGWEAGKSLAVHQSSKESANVVLKGLDGVRVSEREVSPGVNLGGTMTISAS
jgi:T5orf172 domain